MPRQNVLHIIAAPSTRTGRRRWTSWPSWTRTFTSGTWTTPTSSTRSSSPNTTIPAIGERWHNLKGSNYLVDDYIAETQNANVTNAIHVQAALGIPDPVNESAWLQGFADRTGFPHAIVAYSNLKDPNVEAELARHVEYPNVKGIRDFSEGDYLVDPDFHRGYALLEKFGLVASVDVKWEDMGKLRDLAVKFPNIVPVLDHCGFPTSRTDEYFRNWREGLRTLAEAENVVCKISGLGMCDQNWTVDSIRPWVLTCIETFGARQVHLRHELARRPALQHLRRRGRRVHRDHRGVQQGRAGGDVLGQRREAVRDIARLTR